MPPDAPTISLSNDETGTSFTAGITVESDTDTATLYYRKSTESTWTTGDSRTGDGDLQQTGLDRGIYEVVAVSEDDTGALSLPSNPTHVRVYDPDADTTPNRGPLKAMDRMSNLIAATNTWQSWTGSTSTEEARDHVFLFGVPMPITWESGLSVEKGTVTDPLTGDLVFQAQTAGTTASEEPDWEDATEPGDTIEDGGVTWEAQTFYGSATNTSSRLHRPFAVIPWPESYGGEPGEGGGDVSGSTIRIYLEAAVQPDYEYTVETAGMWFGRKCSELLRDMLGLARTPGYAAPNRIRIIDLRRAPEEARENRGDYAYAIMEAQY